MNQSAKMLRLHINGQNYLTLTMHHLLPILTKDGLLQYVRADEIKIGDTLVRFDSASNSLITAVENVDVEGYRNVLTHSGTIVVDGVVASCFTTSHHYLTNLA